MSQTPETPEPGESNLRRALHQLPAHAPDPATWSRVEALLAVDAALARAVPALPVHAPDAAVWGAIVAQLDATGAPDAPVAQPAAPAVVRPLWPARAVRRVLAVAASVLLLLGAWWQLRPVALVPAAPHETLTFSEEESGAPLPAPLPGPDPLERQGLAFIDAHCSSLPAVCGSGQFCSLRTQLAELETQETQLRQDARRFGASPELLREQARLVRLKATVTRELVQLLIS